MSEASTLYDRLGGNDAIEAVVDAFYDRVLADEQLARHFEGTDVDDLRGHQRAFIGSVTGGPVEYDGRDMREAHADLDLTPADFAAVADHLDSVLQEFDVADDDREAVVDLLAGLEGDILADGAE